MSRVLKFKGRKDGVVIVVKRGTCFIEFFDKFRELVNDDKSFFMGSKIVGIEGIYLNDYEKERFKNFIKDMDEFELVSFTYGDKNKPKEASVIVSQEILPNDTSVNQETEQIEQKIPTQKTEVPSVEIKTTDVFYKGTVRSGVKLESEGNITVVGDVNPGAELIAKGNVVVLGKLMGFAYAGRDGDEDKTISAWKLLPTQLRIADYITMPPEEDIEDILYPEMAFIHNGRVIIKSYQ